MLKKISNETLQNFFEQRTQKNHLMVAEMHRFPTSATVIMVDCNNNHYVTFQVSDTMCKASPRERLGNMPELWQAFLAEQKKVQIQEYYAKKEQSLATSVTQ